LNNVVRKFLTQPIPWNRVVFFLFSRDTLLSPRFYLFARAVVRLYIIYYILYNIYILYISTSRQPITTTTLLHFSPMLSLSLLRHAALKTKPQVASTCLRSMQHLVNGNRTAHAISVLPSATNSRQQETQGKHLLTMAGAALAFSTVVGFTQAMAEPEVLAVEDELTPLYDPVFRESGMLQVSDVHTISYKIYGNPKGKPVLCVHGGPGAGTGTGKVYLLLLPAAASL
jgi:hypothetical protein